jgi:hypothetical protein
MVVGHAALGKVTRSATINRRSSRRPPSCIRRDRRSASTRSSQALYTVGSGHCDVAGPELGAGFCRIVQGAPSALGRRPTGRRSGARASSIFNWTPAVTRATAPIGVNVPVAANEHSTRGVVEVAPCRPRRRLLRRQQPGYAWVGAAHASATKIWQASGAALADRSGSLDRTVSRWWKLLAGAPNDVRLLATAFSTGAGVNLYRRNAWEV